jgi:hypothetical protein
LRGGGRPQERELVLPGCFFERFPCFFEQFPCTVSEVRMPERLKLSEEERALLFYWLLHRETLK